MLITDMIPPIIMKRYSIIFQKNVIIFQINGNKGQSKVNFDLFIICMIEFPRFHR